VRRGLWVGISTLKLRKGARNFRIIVSKVYVLVDFNTGHLKRGLFIFAGNKTPGKCRVIYVGLKRVLCHI